MRGVAGDPGALVLGAPRRTGWEVRGLPGRLDFGDAGTVPPNQETRPADTDRLNQSAARSLTGGYSFVPKVGDGNRFLAVRAEPTRTDLAAGPAAVCAPLLAQLASPTAVTFVDGEYLRCAPGLGR